MHVALWGFLTFLCAPVLLFLARLRCQSVTSRILVIQLGKLGDLLATTPMYRAIKEARPGATLHVLCRKGSREALERNPHVDAVHHVDDVSRWELLSRLRALRFDGVINCMPGAFSSIAGLWALIPLRVNTSSRSHGILVRLFSCFNSVNVTYHVRTWTFSHYMRLIEPLGIPPIRSPVLVFVIPEAVQERMDAWLRERGLQEKSFAVFHLTAGNSVKEWPGEKFAALARHVIDHDGLSVVLSTLDVQVMRRVTNLIGRPSRVFDASGLTLAESAALYHRAAAFVSVDTGPLYAASAVGTPLVIIRGPVHPEEQIPREGRHVAHVKPPPGCEPWVFVSLTPREGTQEQLRCARETPVEDVAHTLERVLRV